MKLPFELKIKQYRSIKSECVIPFNRKTTFVIGPNNSGKSNILRALSAVFNKKYATGDKDYKYEINVENSEFRNFSQAHRHLAAASQNIDEEISFTLTKEKIEPANIPQKIYNYTSTSSYINDFSSSSSPEANARQLYQHLFNRSIEKHLNGTVYVPNIRYITTAGNEPQFFSNNEIAGTVLQYGNIINELSALNHPRTENRQESREKFSKLEDFLCYCLDKKKVKIEIPFDRSTIHVDIDGNEHPLQDLGTGIEQLLIIGLASFGFPGKLTLVDEPELHFHPTAQKKMIQYLNNNVADTGFVFATHSAAILDAVEADVLQVAHDGHQSIVKTVSSNKQRYQAVRDLGHSPSDLLLARFAIWVEGPSDRVYLNHWIKKIDPSLVEGVDYTVLFYGGKILSHHTFIDDNSELVKAVSLARAFAVLMDSDRKPGKLDINGTKTRVRDEIEKQGGLCWITDGREVENYLPNDIIRKLTANFPGSSVPATKLSQVLDPKKVKKNDFARSAVAEPTDEWPLDLKQRVTELVEAIQNSR